ncbi:PREDICTED: major facilitator superfamily domain-containing protein 6-like [Wasmannia auropunctata]|uniref:major facilitator superfamily domain-containing protein 6-like n=1 Tax=Wasmannia auropunctata TaxID=64793 RepID=UPI0005ED70C7|nr:PREDICTED: major facilitator superfamily domain-containing protein 6-like [Wasmannia auropunctata]
MKINYTLLSLKAHYFFFMGGMGSIFPFIPVYGKQLGISPIIMGSITTVLPILYMITQPIFGLIMDYFQTKKRLIFMAVLVVANSSYILLYFLPSLPGPILPDHQFQNVSCAFLPFCDINSNSSVVLCDGTKNTTCHWKCKDTNFSLQLSFHAAEEEAVISSNTSCLLNFDEISLCQEKTTENYNCNVTCDNFDNNYCLYTSITFWGFVLLISLGNIGIILLFNINSAICFEILGKGEEMKYGRQRLWGEISYGSAGFLIGYTVDVWSQGKQDLAIKTGYMSKIKLIEGLTVAAEAFACIIFFPVSGKILNKLGYSYTFILSLIFYALRLGLISVAPTPWWIVPIEFIMLGPSYALSFVATVAFANANSSPNLSGSAQGILSGMKGFGFAVGNLVGSTLLKKYGGALTLQIYSICAAFCALMYFLLHITYLKHKTPGTQNNIEWEESDNAHEDIVL